MESRLKSFIELAQIFSFHNFNLYLVGGTSRDYLLNLDLTDMDVVTEATPSEIKCFFENADFTFEKFGSVKLNFNGVKFDITTLREESNYLDNRHPNKVNFVKDLKIDVLRRDFTINALYINKDLEVIDLVDGLNDLKNKKIKMIGNANTRLKEDPLRIIRAIRFMSKLNFEMDQELIDAIKNNIHLLNKINKDKIISELHKFDLTNISKVEQIFKYFNIESWLNVLK